MTFKQDQRLINMLLDMQRCGHLEQFAGKGSDDVCRNTIYNLAEGYIPRAFEEAKCAPEDVKLVIVSNGPTVPIDNNSYPGSPEEDLPLLLADRYLTSEQRSIHKNLRSFLYLAFPNLAGQLNTQLTRVWVTKSVHCTFSENLKIAKRGIVLVPISSGTLNFLVILPWFWQGHSRKKYHAIYHRLLPTS